MQKTSNSRNCTTTDSNLIRSTGATTPDLCQSQSASTPEWLDTSKIKKEKREKS